MSSMRLADVLNPSSTLVLRAGVLATLIWAGHAKAEDLVTPAIEGVVAAGTKIELIQDGFNGTEGPLGLPDGSLVFTETPANRITRIAADGSVSAFLEDSNGSNGLGIDANGDIVSVQRGKPQVGVIYPAEHRKLLVDSFEGKGFTPGYAGRAK